jgi:hypothetical protein
MKLRAGAFTLLVALSAPAVARAAHPPLAQALEGDARALYDGAREAFRAGDYVTAYAKFKRAHELSNDPRLLWNLAACERKAKHNANVMRLIESYLREGEGWIDAADRDEAERAKAAVRAFVAAAKIATDPAEGVLVFVDDVRVATTPASAPIWIDQGLHRVRFAREAYRSVERTEDIPAGAELTWSVTLEPLSTPVTAAPPAIKPEPPPRASSRTGPIALTGAGLAVGLVGGGLVFVTAREHSSLRDDCGTSCDPARWESYRTMQIVGDIALVAGGAALVSGILWWLAKP